MIPNLLSLSRIFFAAAFFQESPKVRLLALILALLSDGLDGFAARRFQMTSRLGTLLDPLADRIFVGVAVAVFFLEGRIELLALLAFFARDLGIFLFGSLLLLKGKLQHYAPHALLSGKAATVVQLIVLILLTLHLAVPLFLYILLAAFGPLAFLELYSRLNLNDHIPPKI